MSGHALVAGFQSEKFVTTLSNEVYVVRTVLLIKQCAESGKRIPYSVCFSDTIAVIFLMLTRLDFTGICCQTRLMRFLVKHALERRGVRKDNSTCLCQHDRH